LPDSRQQIKAFYWQPKTGTQKQKTDKGNRNLSRNQRDASAKRPRKINVADIFNKLYQIDILSEKKFRDRAEISGK
jgi:hypothetical protein